jgi:hypothetical protein
MAISDNQSGASRSSGTSGSSSNALHGATSTVSDIAGQAGERVRDQASRAAGQVQDQAQAFLSEQKEVAAGHIEGVAKVLHETVDQLRQKSPGAVTDYAERAVEGLDTVAHALRERDMRDLVGQVEEFARRQPVLFLAGTVAIGFALARFLKSSGRGDWGYSQDSRDYGSSDQDYSSRYRSGTGGYQSGRTGTEYGRHMATETATGQDRRSSAGASSGSDYQGSGSRTSGVSGSAPAMGSGDGPASPQYSTTRSGGTGSASSGSQNRRSGQESG